MTLQPLEPGRYAVRDPRTQRYQGALLVLAWRVPWTMAGALPVAHRVRWAGGTQTWEATREELQKLGLQGQEGA